MKDNTVSTTTCSIQLIFQINVDLKSLNLSTKHSGVLATQYILLNSKTLASIYLVHSIPLDQCGQKLCVHVALPKESTNQLKPVQQNRQLQLTGTESVLS